MFKKKNSGTTVVAERKPGKKIKPWKIVAVLIVLLLVIRFAVKAVTGGPANTLPAVETAEVVKGDITATLETSGTIVSEVTRVYASPVNAVVGEVPVEMGQTVKKGEYLLTYDTASLQKSYDIAQLQAKAEEATGNDTLAKSNESAADFASSTSDINTLQAQIDGLNAEIASLQAQASDKEKASNTNTSRQEKLTELKAVIEGLEAEITALEQKKAEKTITDKEKDKLDELKDKKKAKEKELRKKEEKIKDSSELANDMINIQSELTRKNNQLADLQSKLGEAQSINASAEAGILTDAAKANIDYNRQASKLTLEQSAEELSLAQAGVTADFDGIVTDVQASPGTMAAEGTALISLASSQDMCVEIPVSKYNLENIKLDQNAVITFQEKEYQGKVHYISKIAQKSESGGAMVTIKVRIDHPDDSLILGLDAKVQIQLGTEKNAILVPISSVNSDTQGDFVYVVEKGVVAKKYVTSGMASNEQIGIKSGLSVGEKVITVVDSSIMEGMAVTEQVPNDTETPSADEDLDLSTETKTVVPEKTNKTKPVEINEVSSTETKADLSGKE